MYDCFMEKFVWQMFILGCGNLDEALKKGLGGVIFFTKDIDSESQFMEQIKNICSKALVPPFLSIDQEGGRVERTEKIRAKRLSAKFAYEKGLEYLQAQSEEISSELAHWGINLNFAPCVDVNSNPNNPIIGERAFSNNVDDVIKGMQTFIAASRKHNVIPCVKHFPGHGDADKDSHLTLPRIDLSLEKMEAIHLKPFKTAVLDGIEMIMAALPEIAKNVAEPLSKVDKITMYGEGNSAKLLSDIVNGTTQVTEGISAGMGIDIKSLIMGALGGKMAADNAPVVVVQSDKEAAATCENEVKNE